MLKNGYGFVEFDDARDADDAVYDLNGKSPVHDARYVECIFFNFILLQI